LDYDDYRPDVMKKSSTNPNYFYKVKMVPPRTKVRYYFSMALERDVPVTPKPEKKNSRRGIPRKQPKNKKMRNHSYVTLYS